MGKGEKCHMTFIGHFRNKKLATKRIEKVRVFKTKKITSHKGWGGWYGTISPNVTWGREEA